MKNADMPAMPTQSNGGDIFGGLTKREMMAMHAMAGLLSGDSGAESCYLPTDLARDAVSYAEALLAELDRTTK